MCLLVSLRKARNVKSIWIQSCIIYFLSWLHRVHDFFSSACVRFPSSCTHSQRETNEPCVTSIIYELILVCYKNTAMLRSASLPVAGKGWNSPSVLFLLLCLIGSSDEVLDIVIKCFVCVCVCISIKALLHREWIGLLLRTAQSMD